MSVCQAKEIGHRVATLMSKRERCQPGGTFCLSSCTKIEITSWERKDEKNDVL